VFVRIESPPGQHKLLAKKTRAGLCGGGAGRITSGYVTEEAVHPAYRPAALLQLMEAPGGFAGWTIPVEPLLQPLEGTAAYQQILERLAERAL